MSEPITIIAYRNPLEQKFYENNGPMIMLVFCITMGVTFFLTYKLLGFLFRKNDWNSPTWFLWVAGIVGCLVGYFSVHFFGLW